MIWPEKGGEAPYGPLTRLDLKLRISDHAGGPVGTLIITQDDNKGGIQSNEIEELLDEVLF